MKTILLATGGTGGHIFPALELARKLKKKNYKPAFIGWGLSNSSYMPKDVYSIFDIASAPFQWKNPIKLFKSLSCYWKGYLQAVKILDQTKPSLIVGFGSYYSFPALVAAYRKKIPYLLYESNSVLGNINRLFSPKAICLAHELFDLELPKKTALAVKVRTTPFHKKDKSMTKESAREQFHLKKDRFTCLIFGGSQGSFSVNKTLLKSFERLNMKNVQLIHLTGKNSDHQAIKEFYDQLGVISYVSVFEQNMSLAYQAADLLIARSGSGTIFEQLAFEVPALYIPLPWAADNHQLKNAMYVQNHLGVAELIEQRFLNETTLKPWIENSSKAQEKLLIMKKNLAKQSFESASESLISLVERYGDCK